MSFRYTIENPFSEMKEHNHELQSIRRYLMGIGMNQNSFDGPHIVAILKHVRQCFVNNWANTMPKYQYLVLRPFHPFHSSLSISATVHSKMQRKQLKWCDVIKHYLKHLPALIELRTSVVMWYAAISCNVDWEVEWSIPKYIVSRIFVYI